MRWRLSASALLAVSFVKAAGYQDAHGADSDSADEQQFVVNEVIALQRTPDWRSTVVIVAYDDSDGWYDHVADSGVHNPSLSPVDNLTDTTMTGPTSGQCGRGRESAAPLAASRPLRVRAHAAAGDLAAGQGQPLRSPPL